MTRRPASGTVSPARRRAWVHLALAVGLVAVGDMSISVSARTMQQRLERVCAGSIDRLCATARPDGDRINACLLSHHDQLPPDCAKLVDIAD